MLKIASVPAIKANFCIWIFLQWNERCSAHPPTGCRLVAPLATERAVVCSGSSANNIASLEKGSQHEYALMAKSS
jgi:hypothetical protein